jgi:hypothetical protein
VTAPVQRVVVGGHMTYVTDHPLSAALQFLHDLPGTAIFSVSASPLACEVDTIP